MQDIATLFTDATIIEEENQGLGAAICVIKNSDQGTKRLIDEHYAFKATNSFEAELRTAVHAIKSLNVNQEKRSLSWICDVPYMRDLFEKKDPRISELLEALNSGDINLLEIRLPEKSREKELHYRCHRMCQELRAKKLLR